MATADASPWRTRSLLQLVVLAFILVVMPLGVLIYQATDSMVTLSRLGREQAQQALEFLGRGQQLKSLSEDLVRSSRQYVVVQKPEILKRFNSQLEQFSELLQVHAFLIDSNTISELLELTQDLKQKKPNKKGVDQVIKLVALTSTLYDDTRQRLEQRLESLNARAQHQQNLLWLQAGLLILMSSVLILFFSIRITTPVKHLKKRIQALGYGQNSLGISFSGPREFIALNQQLDWLEEHLQLLEQEKQAFLRHMSHELKTPLTTLREGTDLLAEELAGPLNDSQQEILQLMQQNGLALQSLIEQLLDYNRLQHSGEPEYSISPVGPIIKEALAAHQLLLQQKEISVALPENEVECRVDKGLLLRTLSNLISNAAVYGNQAGALTVDMVDSKELLMIEVSNTGPTIPTEDLDKLFDPFYQGQNRRQGSIKGSGIGLSIAREAVRAQDGDLILNKNNNGVVSFIITLPKKEAETDD
ncbi:sensor histidine kinase [Amphritea sp. HPY]|uniref:sensor histidine kinase n=1 Tax=Amphritea sp. HPY TaxID=3421652 RepID=UPI003D7EF0A9